MTERLSKTIKREHAGAVGSERHWEGDGQGEELRTVESLSCRCSILFARALLLYKPSVVGGS